VPSHAPESARRTAGVIAPPPLLPLGVILLAEGLRWGWPLPMLASAPEWRYALSITLLAASLTLAGAAVLVLRRARTPVEPWKPTRAIVASGPYAISRNPIYVAFLGAQLAYAWGRGNAWGLLLLPLTVALLHWGVIGREERYLAERFGEPYLAYRRRVRRWL
jgi:protein-S-isoprenylcysteine O-methyltransferase Ste14